MALQRMFLTRTTTRKRSASHVKMEDESGRNVHLANAPTSSLAADLAVLLSVSALMPLASCRDHTKRLAQTR